MAKSGSRRQAEYRQRRQSKSTDVGHDTMLLLNALRERTGATTDEIVSVALASAFLSCDELWRQPGEVEKSDLVAQALWPMKRAYYGALDTVHVRQVQGDPGSRLLCVKYIHKSEDLMVEKEEFATIHPDRRCADCARWLLQWYPDCGIDEISISHSSRAQVTKHHVEWEDRENRWRALMTPEDESEAERLFGGMPDALYRLAVRQGKVS